MIHLPRKRKSLNGRHLFIQEHSQRFTCEERGKGLHFQMLNDEWKSLEESETSEWNSKAQVLSRIPKDYSEPSLRKDVSRDTKSLLTKLMKSEDRGCTYWSLDSYLGKKDSFFQTQLPPETTSTRKSIQRVQTISGAPCAIDNRP
jgi:hypothetical protein